MELPYNPTVMKYLELWEDAYQAVWAFTPGAELIVDREINDNDPQRDNRPFEQGNSLQNFFPPLRPA